MLWLDGRKVISPYPGRSCGHSKLEKKVSRVWSKKVYHKKSAEAVVVKIAVNE